MQIIIYKKILSIVEAIKRKLYSADFWLDVFVYTLCVIGFIGFTYVFLNVFKMILIHLLSLIPSSDPVIPAEIVEILQQPGIIIQPYTVMNLESAAQIAADKASAIASYVPESNALANWMKAVHSDLIEFDVLGRPYYMINKRILIDFVKACKPSTEDLMHIMRSLDPRSYGAIQNSKEAIKVMIYSNDENFKVLTYTSTVLSTGAFIIVVIGVIALTATGSYIYFF